VPGQSVSNDRRRLRIGAVTYLNARPLTFCLARLAPDAQITVDLPSWLADGLVAKRLDVALVPSIEYARHPGSRIVSDACVACDGPVRSVKLYGRVPVEQIRTLALDEGSRTSAALARILLKERFDLEPRLQPLPIGVLLEDCTADATLLVGDRGMLPPVGRFEFIWDLGQQWWEWTGLPFVFAMWVARPNVNLRWADEVLTAARDEGIARLEEIARAQAPAVGLPQEECLSYLRDNVEFHLHDRQREGLQWFYELAGRHGLAPGGVELAFYHQQLAR